MRVGLWVGNYGNDVRHVPLVGDQFPPALFTPRPETYIVRR
jgi:hypothetical protein